MMRFDREAKEVLETLTFWRAKANVAGCKFRPKDLRRLVSQIPTPWLRGFSDLLAWHYGVDFRLSEDRSAVELHDPMLEALMVPRSDTLLSQIPKDDAWTGGTIAVPFKLK